jgi:multidrug efflux pump subunit AcrB
MREIGAIGGVLAYFVRHRTAANLLLIAMLVFGAAAGLKIRKQYYPDIVVDSVEVSVAWRGAGPEAVDSAVVGLLQPALLAVDGVHTTWSTAREGGASITMEFTPGWDMARAAEEVKAAVDSVTNLPAEAKEPKVRRRAWRDRVTDVVLHGPVGAEQLGRLTDEFTGRLFSAGVTQASIRGVASPVVRVSVPEAALIRHDVTLQQIADAIAEEAEADPAGDVGSGAARLRTGVEKRSAEEVGGLAVRVNPDGSRLLVRDVARVEVEGVDRGRAYYTGGEPAISVRIDRTEQGDAIDIQRVVERVAAEMAPTLPQGVKIELIRKRADAITARLDILLDNGLLGLGLVLALLFLFLSARTAFWVAVGIPASMLATVGLMYVFGLTINMVSLFALIICLGIVVDDAIVVGEHADTLARKKGLSPEAAAEQAARRMAAPVFSASITTVIAFAALTLIGEGFGRFIADIPFTVSVVLLASLVECFLILPAHMRHALAAQDRAPWYDAPSRAFNRGFGWFRERLFRPFMAGVIRLRYPALGLAVLVLAWSAELFINKDVPWRFFNAPERPSISGNVAMLPGARRADTIEMVAELSRAVEETAAAFEEEYGVNPVTFAMAEVGGTTGRGLAGQDAKDKDLLGGIAVELVEVDQRPYSSAAFVSALQDNVRRHRMLETMSFRGWYHGPGGDSLDVSFYGAEIAVLKAAAEALKAAVAPFPEVSGVEDSLAYDKSELVLELTPLGERLGFTIDGIGAELYRRLNGVDAAEFPVGARTGKIVVRLAEEELTADFLSRTRLRNPTGGYAMLSEIAAITPKPGFSSISRENGVPVVTVNGAVSEDDPVRAEAIAAALRDEILPDIAQRFGVEWKLGGLAEQEKDFLNEAAISFALVLIGIYAALAWIFASWSRPFAVMLIIPFGFIGAVWGHYWHDVPFSMFSVVGLIGMTGIIINDSIVLITTIDENAERRALAPALLDAACDRLRPVLLTTLTTVFGLAPLLFERSQQAQFLKPTVITLCYGLGFGVVLVLLVTPALVAMQRDVRASLRSLRRVVRLAVSRRRFGRAR